MNKNETKKLIIAGPCAIETKTQFYNTVDQIHHHSDIIRAGAWKARTCAESYPGIGTKALSWIQDVQEKYQTPVAIEVGTPNHVELAIKHNINIIWIGARTTVNPFYVEEIARSLEGSHLEVWVKNPIIADLKLWVGAIERFKKRGIKKIKAIHRGFFNEKKNSIYRNRPYWKLLKDFIKLSPHNSPIICDPSHIAGQKKYVYEIAEKAYENNLGGLMLEVHCNPSQALSDKKQQLNPEEFKRLLSRLDEKY